MRIQTPGNQDTLDAARPSESESLQQLQTELDAFVTSIRGRLESLSKSLASQSTEVQVNEMTEPSCCEAEPDIAPAGAEQESNHIGADNREDSGDPLDRLSAIKLRLAKQLESI